MDSAPPKKKIRIIRRKKVIKKIPTPSPSPSTSPSPSVEHYISTLNADDKKAYEIAKESLGSSFDIEDSIGYKAYCMS